MAKQASMAMLLTNQYQQIVGYCRFILTFIKKKNPIKNCIKSILTAINDLITVNKKLQNIQKAIMVEKYKYKKTELILAQNTDHFFVAGRTIDQKR